MTSATKPLTDLQTFVLKKLCSYKTPKTSRQIFDALSKSGKITNVQQVAGPLRRLEENGYVRGDYGVTGKLEWEVTSKGRKAIGK